MSTELQEYISDFRKACVEWGEAKTDDNHARMIEEQRALFSLIEKGGVSRTEPALTDALRDVKAERARQQSVEGWTPEHDDEHSTAAMGAAAACYALWASAPAAENASWYAAREDAARSLWPWDHEWFKSSHPRRDLVKAGALILAEIERLDRALVATKGQS